MLCFVWQATQRGFGGNIAFLTRLGAQPLKLRSPCQTARSKDQIHKLRAHNRPEMRPIKTTFPLSTLQRKHPCVASGHLQTKLVTKQSGWKSPTRAEGAKRIYLSQRVMDVPLENSLLSSSKESKASPRGDKSQRNNAWHDVLEICKKGFANKMSGGLRWKNLQNMWLCILPLESFGLLWLPPIWRSRLLQYDHWGTMSDEILQEVRLEVDQSATALRKDVAETRMSNQFGQCQVRGDCIETFWSWISETKKLDKMFWLEFIKGYARATGADEQSEAGRIGQQDGSSRRMGESRICGFQQIWLHPVSLIKYEIIGQAVGYFSSEQRD